MQLKLMYLRRDNEASIWKLLELRDSRRNTRAIEQFIDD